MKKKSIFIMMALMAVALMSFTGCQKKYSIKVSTQNLLFGLDAGTKELEIEANCQWTITKNDDADWYTISTMSGENDAVITITVDALEDGDFRGASFVINSPGGHVYRTIFVSQNKVDFDGMINKVYGVMDLEHWNTDYFGQIIEETYRHYTFDPYDTTTGYIMFFLEDGKGLQRDHHNDTVAYYAFTYEYNSVDQILHIEFETIDGAPEDYDPQVLTASDSLYRFMHEYKSNWWERADMRKIADYVPEDVAKLRSVATKKRKGHGPIFQID